MTHVYTRNVKLTQQQALDCDLARGSCIGIESSRGKERSYLEITCKRIKFIQQKREMKCVDLQQ